MKGLRLTQRGWFVLTIAGILAAIGINILLSDVCWVGNGYGSCQELRNTYKGARQ